jgi:hypothetical protein
MSPEGREVGDRSHCDDFPPANPTPALVDHLLSLLLDLFLFLLALLLGTPERLRTTPHCTLLGNLQKFMGNQERRGLRTFGELSVDQNLPSSASTGRESLLSGVEMELKVCCFSGKGMEEDHRKSPLCHL